MYNIKLYDYVPEPKPAKSDRIVAAHYYAAWKKGAAGIHGAFDDLHDYPDRTPLMGYYDEENPTVCDWEIKWASEHGINCFIHCWYRKKNNMGQPITVGDLRCGHGLHEALFNARYQKCMKFAIMFEASPRWGGTDEADMLEHLLPFWMEQYFKRENYLTIDNKPVLFVYQQERLQAECFQSAESQKKTFDACREYAKKFGFDGMIFAACNTSLDPAEHEDIISRGYDFRFGYNAGYNSPCDYYEDMDDIINQQCGLLKQRLATDNMRYIATASCFSDPTPRFSQHWLDMGYEFRKWNNIWYLPPERFRDLLREMKQISDSLPEGAWAKKIMMIDNWNEWDEGHFVAPSHRFGFQYLQAIREALTECDNLPDYRTPQDLGFTDLNQSWQIPDMTEPSKKYRENQTSEK